MATKKFTPKQEIIHQNNILEFKDLFTHFIDEYDMNEIDPEIRYRYDIKWKGIYYRIKKSPVFDYQYRFTNIIVDISSYQEDDKFKEVREIFKTGFRNQLEAYNFTLKRFESRLNFNGARTDKRRSYLILNVLKKVK